MHKLILCAIITMNLSYVSAQELNSSDSKTDIEGLPSVDSSNAQVVETKPSLCEKISCSGHGVCVESNGNPTCACDQDFAPDSHSGLNCLPLETGKTLESVAAMEGERQEMLNQFYSVLPTFPADRYYSHYVRIRSYGRYKGSFFDYMAGEFRKKRGGSIAMSAIGGALLLSSIIMIPIGANADSIFDPCPVQSDTSESCTDPEETKIVLLAAGGGFAVAGTVLLSIGIPKAIKASKRLKAVNTLRPLPTESAPQPVAPVSDLQVSYKYEPSTNYYGLSVNLKF